MVTSSREGGLAGCYQGREEDGHLLLLQTDKMICLRSRGRPVTEIWLGLMILDNWVYPLSQEEVLHYIPFVSPWLQ